MNPNIMLAILEAKKVITAEEAKEISDYISTGVQSSNYRDAQDVIKKVLSSK